jgi:1,2-diacylglycerol 3-beta-glucosyltransferase
MDMVMSYLFLIFFILSCVTNGIYYLWLTLLSVFPQVHNYSNIKYSEDIDLSFFILIPCLNEGKVIYQTVKNLLSLNMPDTTVIVINDGSTDDTLELLNSIKDNRLKILTRTLPNARKGKGKALNDGYREVKRLIGMDPSKCEPEINYIKKIADGRGIDHSKVIIGILDADTFIKRDILERVAVIMDSEPKVGMVQARVRIGISTRNYFLPLMQDIEFFTFINRMQNVREYTGTVAAAGNGQFNRLSAMETLGDEPWSQCLLEDFDFSLRLLLKGWRTRLVQEKNIYQQGVINYRKFVKQRARWSQGCIQCAPYCFDVVKSKHLSFWGKAEILYFLILPGLTLASSATLIFSWFLILYTYINKSSILYLKLSPYPAGELIALLVLILIFVYLPGILFSLSYWHDTKESLYRIILCGLFMPIYNMMQMPAVIIAACRQIGGINSWVKTDRTDS